MEESRFNSTKELAGQIAIVTGGASGIGRATCKALSKEGASVVVVDINEGKIQETLMGLDEAGNDREAMGIVADVRRQEDLEEMVRKTLDRYARINILVHCAGILRGEGGAPRIMAEISTEEMNNVIDTNLKGTFLCNRSVLPTMMNQRAGKIVNVSSTSGRKGRPLDSVYCASKFGVIGLSESLAEEVRQYGIKVQTVLPDAVDTPLWDQNGPIRAPEYSLPPERVADLIVYMLILPDDALLENIVVLPFVQHRRKRR